MGDRCDFICRFDMRDFKFVCGCIVMAMRKRLSPLQLVLSGEM